MLQKSELLNLKKRILEKLRSRKMASKSTKSNALFAHAVFQYINV
jgi:hypothetical protein